MAILLQLLDDNILNKFEIGPQGITIGRSVKNDIVLDNPSVSQQHARILGKELKDGARICFIEDLKSTNKTFVNNNAIEQWPLSDQDIIVIGTKSFKFVDPENEKLASTKAFKKSWIPGMFFLED
ncbi:FHA domain-containing protein [Aliikangiella maris]|uniref:FHA domain-containing protein n=2 Tax=Aliikangiella maris TaxID=3162458 RepID=A0ABV2BTV3_9GAMM